jgi:hypothetical protein
MVEPSFLFSVKKSLFERNPYYIVTQDIFLRQAVRPRDAPGRFARPARDLQTFREPFPGPWRRVVIRTSLERFGTCVRPLHDIFGGKCSLQPRRKIFINPLRAEVAWQDLTALPVGET